MPECAFHPGVETSVRCVECDRYMCPKDYVTTPVGFKCKECARQPASARRAVKPRQLALAIVVALAVGIGGAFALAYIRVYFWVAIIALGMLTGEAARRGSGGHRGGAIAAVAGASALLGTLLANFGPFEMVLATGAAVAYVMSNRW